MRGWAKGLYLDGAGSTALPREPQGRGELGTGSTAPTSHKERVGGILGQEALRHVNGQKYKLSLVT